MNDSELQEHFAKIETFSYLFMLEVRQPNSSAVIDDFNSDEDLPVYAVAPVFALGPYLKEFKAAGFDPYETVLVWDEGNGPTFEQ